MPLQVLLTRETKGEPAPDNPEEVDEEEDECKYPLSFGGVAIEPPPPGVGQLWGGPGPRQA